jgi:hypothetical protein
MPWNWSYCAPCQLSYPRGGSCAGCKGGGFRIPAAKRRPSMSRWWYLTIPGSGLLSAALLWALVGTTWGTEPLWLAFLMTTGLASLFLGVTGIVAGGRR